MRKLEWGMIIAVVVMLLFMLMQCKHTPETKTVDKAFSTTLKEMILETGKTQNVEVDGITGKRLDLLAEYEGGDWIFVMVTVIDKPEPALDIIYIAHWNGSDQLAHYVDIGLNDICDFATLSYNGKDQTDITKDEFQVLFGASSRDVAQFIKQELFEIDEEVPVVEIAV